MSCAADTLPEWNPFAGMGMPVVATGVDAPLHPFNALLAALPFEVGSRHGCSSRCWRLGSAPRCGRAGSGGRRRLERTVDDQPAYMARWELPAREGTDAGESAPATGGGEPARSPRGALAPRCPEVVVPLRTRFRLPERLQAV
jgi:hypothetical protein